MLPLKILTPPPNPIPNKTGNNKTHNQTPAANPYLHVRYGSHHLSLENGLPRCITHHVRNYLPGMGLLGRRGK